MKIPNTLKQLLIVVFGILILAAMLNYFYSNENKFGRNPPPTPAPAPSPAPTLAHEPVKVDFAQITDPQAASLFRALEQEVAIADLRSEHVLTVYSGNNKTEYTHYSVSYGDFDRESGKMLSQPEFDLGLSELKKFINSQQYILTEESPSPFPSYRSVRLSFEKNGLGCATDFFEFPVSVLICQKQIPESLFEVQMQVREDTYKEDWSVSDEAVRFVKGNHIRGSMRRGGEDRNWLAVKQNGKWLKVAEARGFEFDCGVIDQYKFPVEIYGNCIEDQFNMRQK